METQTYRTSKGHDVKDLLEKVNQLSPEDRTQFITQLEKRKGSQEWAGSGIKKEESQRASHAMAGEPGRLDRTNPNSGNTTTRGINSSAGKESFRGEKSSNYVGKEPVGSDIE